VTRRTCRSSEASAEGCRLISASRRVGEVLKIFEAPETARARRNSRSGDDRESSMQHQPKKWPLKSSRRIAQPLGASLATMQAGGRLVRAGKVQVETQTQKFVHTQKEGRPAAVTTPRGKDRTKIFDWRTGTVRAARHEAKASTVRAARDHTCVGGTAGAVQLPCCGNAKCECECKCTDGGLQSENTRAQSTRCTGSTDQARQLQSTPDSTGKVRVVRIKTIK